MEEYTFGKAIKKPIPVDYFYLENNQELTGLKEWVEFNSDVFEDKFDFIEEGEDGASLKVKTVEGNSYHVPPDYFILRGQANDYWPVKGDIFRNTYDVIVDDIS